MAFLTPKLEVGRISGVPTFGNRPDVVDFHPLEWERFGTAFAKTGAVFVHFDPIFLGERYSLTFLIEEICPQFLDEITKGLIAELHIVSLTEYLDTLETDQAGIIWIGGQVFVAFVEVEVDGKHRKLIA